MNATQVPIIRDVCITAARWVDGSYLSNQALRDVARLSENKMVFFGHLPEHMSDSYRPTEDCVALIRNTRVKGEEVRADLELRSDHPRCADVLESPQNFGLSVNGLADPPIEIPFGGKLVTREVEVFSVDLAPGDQCKATKNLFESRFPSKREHVMNATVRPQNRTVHLFEQVQLDNRSRVDQKSGVIRDAKVLGKESLNGRTYTPEAMRDAVPMYEGIGVNLGHPEADNPRRERNPTEGIGWIENAYLDRSGDIRGDFHVLKEHPMGPAILEAASRNPARFALSHNADGDLAPGPNGTTAVTKINKVRSVDVVQKGATNASIFESIQLPTSRTTTIPEDDERVDDMASEDEYQDDLEDDDDDDQDDFETKMRKIWGDDDLEESAKVAATKDLIGSATGMPSSSQRPSEVIGSATGMPARDSVGPDQLGVGDRRNPRSSGGAGSGPDAGLSVPAPKFFSESLMEAALFGRAQAPVIPARRQTRKSPSRKTRARLLESASAQLPMPRSTDDFVRMVTGRRPR